MTSFSIDSILNQKRSSDSKHNSEFVEERRWQSNDSSEMYGNCDHAVDVDSMSVVSDDQDDVGAEDVEINPDEEEEDDDEMFGDNDVNLSDDDLGAGMNEGKSHDINSGGTESSSTIPLFKPFPLYSSGVPHHPHHHPFPATPGLPGPEGRYNILDFGHPAQKIFLLIIKS